MGGDGRGTGFLRWLKEREISKSQAYAWIQLANSADTLIEDGKLDPGSVNNFSKRAFVETSKASPEVQQMVSEAAQKAIASPGAKCVNSAMNGQLCPQIYYLNLSEKSRR